MTATEMICFEGIVLFNKARPLSQREGKILRIVDCFNRGITPLTIHDISNWIHDQYPGVAFSRHYIRRQVRALVESGVLVITEETKFSKEKSYKRR